MKKTVVILMLITIISKILGFSRDVFLSYFYGASFISDVFLISLVIPTVIFEIIGKGISTGFIPMYSRIEQNLGNRNVHVFTNNVVNTVIVICTFIILLGLLFTEPIVKIFASGFEGDALKLAVLFTRITLISLYFNGMIYVFTAYLQMKNVFVISALLGLPANVIVIGSIFISSYTNVYVLAIGSIIAVFSQFVLVIIFSFHNKYRYQFSLQMKDPHLKKMIIIAIPSMLGASLAQVNILVDRTIASQIIIGGISSLNYANTLSLFIVGIVVSSVTTVFYPTIAKLAAENSIDQLKKKLAATIKTIITLLIPATVGYMIFATPIVTLLYGRGQFDTLAISLTSNAVFFYSIGMVGFCLQGILAKVFYSFQDTKTPLFNAILSIAINIVLNLILSKYLGIGGLALASSIAILVATFHLYILLIKKIGSIGEKALLIFISKILSISLLMGIISKTIYGLLITDTTLGSNISIIITIVAAMIIYFSLISLFKIIHLRLLLLEFKQRKEISKEDKVS